MLFCTKNIKNILNRTTGLLLVVVAMPCLLQIVSCSTFINKTKQRNKDAAIQPFIPAKDSLYIIKSFSVINRISFNPNRFYKLDKAKIDTGTNDFNKIVEVVDRMSQSYNIRFANQGAVSNDSIYKKQISNRDFRNRFEYTQMGGTDFSSKEDGLHIIVSVIKEYTPGFGWSGGPASYLTHVVYDFFDVKNGQINRHTTISHYRASGAKNWGPQTSDTEKVFKKLYRL